MMKRLLLLAALFAVLSPRVSAQTPLTRVERDALEQTVEALGDTLDDARDAFDDVRPGQDVAAVTAEIRRLETQIQAAREDLARDDQLRAAARTPEATRPDVPLDPGRRDTVTRRQDNGTARAAESDSPTSDAQVAELSPDQAASPWYTDWRYLALVFSLLALAAASWWFLRTRQTTPVARPAYGSVPGAPLPGQTVPRHEFDRLAQQVQTLATELGALRDWTKTDYERRQTAAVSAPAPAVPTPTAPALAPADAAAAAFADWCRQGTPMMSRVDFFAGMLGTRVPGASAQAVYRDAYSQSEPVRFDGRGGASPAEFWLVTVGGDTLLFPQPLNAGQFRDLTRVFEGTAAPKTVAHIVPARVRDEGGAFALTAPGRVG